MGKPAIGGLSGLGDKDENLLVSGVVIAGGAETEAGGISDVYEEGEKQEGESRPAMVRCQSAGGEGERGRRWTRTRLNQNQRGLEWKRQARHAL